MPRGDGTGPMGYGPKTGWGAGFCTGNPEPGYMSRMPGRGIGGRFGRGRGFGGGMGRGRWARRGAFFAQPNPQEERRFLEDHMEALQSRLDVISRRLEELTAQETRES